MRNAATSEVLALAKQAKNNNETTILIAAMNDLGYHFEMHVGTRGIFLSQFYVDGYDKGPLYSGETFRESVCAAALARLQ